MLMVKLLVYSKQKNVNLLVNVFCAMTHRKVDNNGTIGSKLLLTGFGNGPDDAGDFA